MFGTGTVEAPPDVGTPTPTVKARQLTPLQRLRELEAQARARGVSEETLRDIAVIGDCKRQIDQRIAELEQLVAA